MPWQDNIVNALRGGGRSLLADTAGAPVDLATTLTNLGIAGGGYLGHELGLLDQPPDLIDPKNVPFSSDWLSRGTPLERQEQESPYYYDVSRAVTGLAPTAAQAMSLREVPGIIAALRENAAAPRAAPMAGSLAAQRGGVPLSGSPQQQATTGIENMRAEVQSLKDMLEFEMPNTRRAQQIQSQIDRAENELQRMLKEYTAGQF